MFSERQQKMSEAGLIALVDVRHCLHILIIFTELPGVGAFKRQFFFFGNNEIDRIRELPN